MRLFSKSAAFVSVLVALCTSTAAQADLTDAERKALAVMADSTKHYVELREKHQRKLGKPSDDASPEEIARHKLGLRKAMIDERTGTTQGIVFTPTAEAAIRRIIKTEFQGWERSELRKTVLEADTSGVRLRVNAVYPETKELVEMSPTLLMRLPQLDRSLRYRFVGRSLVIMDRDTGIIVDLMKNALP